MVDGEFLLNRHMLKPIHEVGAGKEVLDSSANPTSPIYFHCSGTRGARPSVISVPPVAEVD